MQEKKVSVIVPVYNVQEYLEECINSIINQTYKNLEIILINDGSTDLSGKICDDFSLKDSRVKVIHKENEGVSVARNLGVEIAKGDLILFVDADDYINKIMIEKLLEVYCEDELVVCSYNILKKGKIISIELNNGKIDQITPQNALEFLANREKIQGYLWNKLFSKKIIIANNIKFDNDIHICEDLYFVAQYITYIKKINYINLSLYNYRKRENSAISVQGNLEKRITILKAYEKLLRLYETKNIKTDYLEYWYIRETINIKLRFLLNKYKVPDEIENKITEKFANVIKNKNIKHKEKFKLIIYYNIVNFLKIYSILWLKKNTIY